MAFQPPSDQDRMSASGLEPSVVDPHEDVGGIKSEPPDIAEVRYDLDGSNSCFGIPFTIDDTWSKTPLMEELDSLAATSASAASSLGDDDGDLRPPLTQALTQWRMQEGKILKLPTSLQATVPPSLPSSLVGRTPTKCCIVDNKPGSPILSDSLGACHEKKAHALAEEEYVDAEIEVKDKAVWLTGYDSNSPQNCTGKFLLQPVINIESVSSGAGEPLTLSPSHIQSDPTTADAPQPVLELVSSSTDKSSIAKNGLLPVGSGASPPDAVSGGGDNKVFPCSICGMCFQSVASLTCHVVNHALCRTCGLVFRDGESLSLHEQIHHSKDNEGHQDSSVTSTDTKKKPEQEIDGKESRKRGVGGIRSKGEKTVKKSLNQKMPCLALALSTNSFHLNSEHSNDCKKATSGGETIKMHDQQPAHQSLKNHLVTKKVKPVSAERVKKKIEKKERTRKKAATSTTTLTQHKSVKCALCLKKFPSTSQLQDHHKLSHACCSICSEVCQDSEELCVHKRLVHCVCLVCGWKAETPQHLVQHEQQHLECGKCGASFKDQLELELHRNSFPGCCQSTEYIKTEDLGEENKEVDAADEFTEEDMSLDFDVEPQLVMDDEADSMEKSDKMDTLNGMDEYDRDALSGECSEEDAELETPKQQQQKQHSQPNTYTKCQDCGVQVPMNKDNTVGEHLCWLMRCPLCDKPFKSVEKLALHKISDHPGCAECDAVFKNFDSLTLHEELQHFRCAICANKCSDHEGLMLHKRVEHTKCKWCKKWFRDRCSLVEHEEQGPFPCGECDAEFCSMSELVLHEKETHLMCSVCKVVCTSRKELLMHTHHCCKLCSLEFLSSGALADHQHREHSKCQQCGTVFRDVDTLTRHSRVQHCEHIKCTVCGALFTSTGSLMEHLKHHIPCKTCATFFKDTKSLAQHEKKDHAKNSTTVMNDPTRYQQEWEATDEEEELVTVKSEPESDIVSCALCNKTFVSKQKLAVHERLEHEQCRQCGAAFFDKTQLSMHRRSAHRSRRKCSMSQEGGTESPEREELMDVYLGEDDLGEEDFGNLGDLNVVSKVPGILRVKPQCTTNSSSGDDRDWACSLCSKAFPSKKNLNAHYKRVHMGKSSLTSAAPVLFKCSFCPQTFTCRNDFVEHNRDCSKGKRVPCNICGKTFSTSGNLAQHKRIHTSEKPYKCDTCGKAFAQNGTLYRHKTVHTKETPFACQACGKQFGLKGNLVMHLRNIHKIVYKEPSYVEPNLA